MKTLSLASLLLIFTLASCKKNHICYCTQDNFPDKTVTIKDTKKSAKVKCKNAEPIFDNSYPLEPEVIGRYNCNLK